MQRVFKHNKAAVAGVIVLIVFIGAAFFASRVAPHDPLKTSNDTFQPPSWQFLFGTDDLGRDILSGVVYGAQTSILIGVTVELLSG